MILVSALDQLLLCLFEAEGSDESLAILRNVNVGHVAWVVHSRLPMYIMMIVAHGVLLTAPISTMMGSNPSNPILMMIVVMVDSAGQTEGHWIFERRLIMTLIYGVFRVVLHAVRVQVWLRRIVRHQVVFVVGLLRVLLLHLHLLLVMVVVVLLLGIVDVV